MNMTSTGFAQAGIDMASSVSKLPPRPEEGSVYRDLQWSSHLDPSYDTSAITSEVLEYYSERDTRKHKVLVLRGVFSPDECRALIAASEGLGFESLEHVYDLDYRNNTRVMVDDERFAEVWYERMRSHIAEYLEGYEDRLSWRDIQWGSELPVGMNERLRICRYQVRAFPPSRMRKDGVSCS
jgi:hypothetical protein